jgi:DNA invertase Pin-like site-specific DNA recombinase
MTAIGYARVSTSDQSLEIQEAALRAAGCDVIMPKSAAELRHRAGTSFRRCWIFLGTGDALMVTRIDRLARSIGDLQDIVRAVKAKQRSQPEGH